MAKTWAVVFMVLVFGGFSAFVQAQEADSPNRLFESVRPATAAEIAAIRKEMNKRLFDAESARFSDVAVYQDKDLSGPACGMINAKNRMGGYTGYHAFMAYLLRSGADLAVVVIGIDSDEAGVVAQMCSELKVKPRPSNGREREPAKKAG